MLRPFRHFDHQKNSELLVQPRRKDIIHVMPSAMVEACKRKKKKPAQVHVKKGLGWPRVELQPPKRKKKKSVNGPVPPKNLTCKLSHTW